ncbi:hypothetical protein D3C78_1182610 [compost metagenome]
MATPSAFSPLTRNCGDGGSAGIRRIVASSVSGTNRSFARSVMVRRLSSETKLPLTRRAILSSARRTVPAGLTAF